LDVFLGSILSSIPQLGVGGGLAVVVVLLLRREAQANARHAAELHRITSSHDEELAELRTEIGGLRTQLEELNRKLDGERDRRRAAEDAVPTRRRAPGGAP
jgi:chromosome segregation ATPase